jgi:hypothetical protein
MLLAGSVAGLATWSVPYPFDVIKSQVQTLPLGTPKQDLKMWKIAQVYTTNQPIKSTYNMCCISISC